MSNAKFDEMLARGMGAVDDVRAKLEEVMWGRTVTDSQAPAQGTTAEPAAALTPFQEYAKEAARAAPQREEIAQEPGIDR